MNGALAVDLPDEQDYGNIQVEEGDDGSLLVDLEPRQETDVASDRENLAEGMSQNDLNKIGQKICEWVDADLNSRKQWMDRRELGIKRSGITGEPQAGVMEGGSTVIHPMLIEAAVQFQARWIEEMFPPSGPVKALILGDSNEALEEQRERVEEHMNYQLTEEDEEYFEDMDRMGLALPFDGSTFKKSYFDVECGYVTSKFIPAEDIVVPYTAKSLKRAPRITHKFFVSQNEMKKYVADGYYLGTQQIPTQDIDVNSISDLADAKAPTSLQEDVEHLIYECHCDYVIDGDEKEIALPHIISVDKETQKPLSIRRNWRPDDEKKRRRNWFNHYKYLPGLGFYGSGLYHAIGGLGEGATGLLRGILDAVAFGNWQGGFTSKDIKVKEGQIKIKPGVYQQTENTAEELRAAFYTPPFHGPDASMFQVLGLLVESGHRFLSTTEAMVGEGATNIPVGTTIARIEQGSKVYSAIHKRSHRSAAQEFKLRAELNYEYLDETGRQYARAGRNLQIRREDYDSTIDVIPVSDPHIASTQQRVAVAQAVIERSQQSPLYDKYEIEKNFLRALKVSDIDSLLQKPDDFIPMDPVTEGQMMFMGRGVRSFLEQNHQAHLSTHMLQFQMVQGLPFGPQVAPIVMSHIQEHSAMEYRIQMMQALQGPLPEIADKPSEQEEIPPEIEAQISMEAAQISQQLMQQMQQNNPEAQKASMDQEKHAMAKQAHEAQMAKAQKDMGGPDLEAKLQAEVQKVQADAAVKIQESKYQADQKIAQAQAEMKQEMAEKIAEIQRQADDEIDDNDAQTMKSQMAKETAIEVAKIQRDSEAKISEAKRQSESERKTIVDAAEARAKTLEDSIKELKQSLKDMDTRHAERAKAEKKEAVHEKTEKIVMPEPILTNKVVTIERGKDGRMTGAKITETAKGKK